MESKVTKTRILLELSKKKKKKQKKKTQKKQNKTKKNELELLKATISKLHFN